MTPTQAESLIGRTATITRTDNNLARHWVGCTGKITRIIFCEPLTLGIDIDGREVGSYYGNFRVHP